MVLIIMFVSASLLMALVSGFLPFVKNYGSTVQYTTAYYGALSAVERGVLAANYAGPGFDGKSGRKAWAWAQNQPTKEGTDSDARLPNFYTYGNGNDSLYREVSSSTTSIPKEGEGNIDYAFVEPNKKNNYNALFYNQTEIIPLGTIREITAQDYYKKENKNRQTTFEGNDAINIDFRLNPILAEKFKNTATLGTNDNRKLLTRDPQNNSKTLDKPMVSWIIKGEYNNKPYSLIPRNNFFISDGTVGESDTLIRASTINTYSNQNTTNNQDPTVSFGKNENFNIFPKKTTNKNLLNAISSKETELKEKQGYTEIFKASENTTLTFNLANILRTVGLNGKSNFYPFLEYKITSNKTPISDRFFTIKGEGKVSDYNIKMQVKKPTLPQPALGSFTIIF